MNNSWTALLQWYIRKGGHNFGIYNTNTSGIWSIPESASLSGFYELAESDGIKENQSLGCWIRWSKGAG